MSLKNWSITKSALVLLEIAVRKIKQQILFFWFQPYVEPKMNAQLRTKMVDGQLCLVRQGVFSKMQCQGEMVTGT
jgi:hypothetical protein